MNGRNSGHTGDSIRVRLHDLEKLTAAADGNAALLYLWLLGQEGGFSVQTAARALQRTEREMQRAAQQLRDMGLMDGTDRLPPPEELPEYRTEELTAAPQDDRGFRDVVAEAQRVLGRMLSGADMKTLFGIYDYLGMPAEVIMMLLNHCVEICAQRYGPGRMPTMRMVEKEAYIWANSEVMSLSRAEAYLQGRRVRGERVAAIKRELSIRDRELTKSERDYVEGWIEMGFETDAIAEAYDRTVVKTGGLRWAYLDKILKNWHEKGLHTLDEVTGERRVPKTENAGTSAYDELERLERILDRQTADGTKR